MLLSLLFVLVSFAQAGDVTTQEKLGSTIPLDLEFTTDSGEKKTIKELMDGKPTLLTLNYYRCAGVCTMELEGLAETLEKVDLKEGVDYQVLTVSFLEEETQALAKRKRRTILGAMQRPFDNSAWNFVVSKNGNVLKLIDAVGFKFEKSDLPSVSLQYTHGTGVIVLSAEGKITRYLRGINQVPVDVKTALIEAKKGIVGTSIPKGLESCSDYHPQEKYIAPTEKIVAIVITVLSLALLFFLYRSAKKSRTSISKEEYYKQQEEAEKEKRD